MRPRLPDYVSMAISLALQSRVKQRHGAVIVHNNEVIGVGFNKYDFYSKKRRCSIHAEEDAINHVLPKNAGKLPYSRIIVVRVNAAGEMKLSKPCDKCYRCIVATGIKRVYYSFSDEMIVEMKIRQFVD